YYYARRHCRSHDEWPRPGERYDLGGNPEITPSDAYRSIDRFTCTELGRSIFIGQREDFVANRQMAWHRTGHPGIGRAARYIAPADFSEHARTKSRIGRASCRERV